MSIRRLVAGFTLAAAALAAPAKAGTVFDEADRLYAAREGNAANVGAARAEYKRVMAGLTGKDLAYAVQQIGRLALYEGQYLLPDSSANRARKASLFDDCRKTAKLLEGAQAQISVYAYWRMSCTAQWMKYAAVTDRLAELPEIKRYFNEIVDDQLEVKPQLGIDLRYQGGGINRALAGIYSNSLASLIRDGLPNGAKALEMADRALRAGAFPGDPNRGVDYYRNHRQKAEVQTFLQRDADAQATLGTAIEEIEELDANGELPTGLEPETKGELALMKAMHH